MIKTHLKNSGKDVNETLAKIARGEQAYDDVTRVRR